jgi:hypothetical protein
MDMNYSKSSFFCILKSEVAITSLFCQTKQPETFLLQVKTITKSPGIGIAVSVKSCNLHQKGSFKALKNDFKGEIASKIQFRPTQCIQTDVCNQIISVKTNKKCFGCLVF